jgi:hypothetical protein
MTITGSNQLLDRFVRKASDSHETPHGQISEQLSFWNFISPSDLSHYQDNWYEWNLENWGTKWDAADPEITDESEGRVTYSFRTAWSPPTPIFEEIVRQYPGLYFDIKCVEEQGWGVEYDGIDGDLVQTYRWDIPDSHKESMERTGECQCDWMDDTESEYMHDDCPRKREKVTA